MRYLPIVPFCWPFWRIYLGLARIALVRGILWRTWGLGLRSVRYSLKAEVPAFTAAQGVQMSLKLKFIALVTIGVFAVMCGGAWYLDGLLERLFAQHASELVARANGVQVSAGVETHRMEVLRAVFDLCGILAVAVSAGIYLVFARQVNQRMSRLVQVVNAVAQNPTAAERTLDKSGDEVGRLAAAFDQAADSFSKAFASLESKVEQRNLALSATQGSKSAIIDGSLDGIIKADETGRIVLCNPAAERTFGYQKLAAIGRSLSEFIELPDAADGSVAEQLPALVGRRQEMVGIRASGTRLPIEVAWTRIDADDPPVFAAFIRDLTEKHRIDRRLHLQLEVTQLLAGRPPLEAALNGVLEIVCRQAGWDVALLWQVNSDQGKLRCQRVLHPSTPLASAFDSRLRELAVPRGMGLAGAVWENRRARWRADLSIEPDIDTAAALDSGLRSAACFAVSTGERTLGVCQFFSSQPKPADREMIALVEGIGAQLGLFVEQEMVARSLAESECRFRSFVAATSQMFWGANAEGEIVETHKAWEEFTGQTAAEASGHGWMKSVRPDDVERVAATIERAKATVSQFDVQCHVRRHDGAYRLFELRGVPVVGDSGTAEQWVGTAADIQDKWQSEQSLLEREAQLRALFESALDGMMIMDDDGRMIEANPAACDVLARSRSELQALHVHDVTAPGVRAKALWRAFRGRRRLSGEFGICRPDGSVRELEFQAIADFQPGRHLSIFRDVTDRKRLEGQLLQSQKMDAVGQLAGGVAHDFNNLLTIILSLCEIGLDAKADDPILADIDRAGKRAADLTRQLLAFSRKQVLTPVTLNLNELVSNLEKMIRRLIGEDIDLATSLDPQLDAVLADASQIEQVIMNLVINSRDAMPTGGQLTIRTANVVIADDLLARHPSAKPGDYVLLSITDTGIGMDELTKSRIFEPFFTTKAQGKGTGLGLATVYGIVEQSAGFIDVASAVGSSTCMNVYLPRMQAAPSLPTEISSRPRKASGGTETILLVEDEQGVRSLARQALESRGYRVLEAANGVDALELQAAFDGEIHLLLTDVVMPHLGGRELADRLLAENPQTSVLYMSGYTDAMRSSVARYHGSIGVPFLQKPFTPDALGPQSARSALIGSVGHDLGLKPVALVPQQRPFQAEQGRIGQGGRIARDPGTARRQRRLRTATTVAASQCGIDRGRIERGRSARPTGRRIGAAGNCRTCVRSDAGRRHFVFLEQLDRVGRALGSADGRCDRGSIRHRDFAVHFSNICRDHVGDRAAGR